MLCRALSNALLKSSTIKLTYGSFARMEMMTCNKWMSAVAVEPVGLKALWSVSETAWWPGIRQSRIYVCSHDYFLHDSWSVAYPENPLPSPPPSPSSRPVPSRPLLSHFNFTTVRESVLLSQQQFYFGRDKCRIRFTNGYSMLRPSTSIAQNTESV